MSSYRIIEAQRLDDGRVAAHIQTGSVNPQKVWITPHVIRTSQPACPAKPRRR